MHRKLCNYISIFTLSALGVAPLDAAAQPTPEPAPPAEAQGDDVLVEGERLRSGDVRGTEAAEVISTEEAQQESVDMGTLLNRTKGVTLRQSGGLGNPGLFYIHGLYGKRIRFFVDGVPAEQSLLGLSPSDLPVHLIDTIEIHKGVVPIRLGADALGGAVNMTTREVGAQSFLDTSSRLGSYGLLRSSVVGRTLLEPQTQLFLDVNAFIDRADNDYPVDVELTDARGKLVPATVRRFHDGYDAYGVGATLGVMNQPWARRLSAGVFTSQTDKEVQSNPRMTVPYGDITQGEDALGAQLRYQLGDDDGPWSADLLVSYVQRDARFVDISRNLWDWSGDIINSRANPGERSRGERVTREIDQLAGRLNLGYRVASHSRLELNILPSSRDETRTTELTVDAGVEPTQASYALFKVASGLSWRLTALEGALESDTFAKHFYTKPGGDLSSDPSGQQDFETQRHAFGAGEGLRLRLLRGLDLKASYEYAVRVPDAEELFGDGGFVAASTDLRDERSHNLNLGVLAGPLESEALGRLTSGVNLFFRRTSDLIFLTVILDSARYQNISDVDTQGVEADISWTGWEVLTLGANGTWFKAANTTTTGYFGRFEGERIPNIPWLLANFNAAVQLRGPHPVVDPVRVYWYGHYAHEFFLFWENEGIKSSKLKVPAYFTQDAGVSMRFLQEWMVVDLEVQNLTDERRFDNVGAQLPGRTWNMKLSLSLD